MAFVWPRPGCVKIIYDQYDHGHVSISLDCFVFSPTLRGNIIACINKMKKKYKASKKIRPLAENNTKTETIN